MKRRPGPSWAQEFDGRVERKAQDSQHATVNAASPTPDGKSSTDSMAEPVGALPRTATASTWADEVEEEEERLIQAGETLEAPTVGPPHSGPPQAARSPRAPAAAARPAPSGPPYKIYISNLPWEVDEYAIERFFQGLEIRDIILLRHHDTQKPKGCFVEFGSVQNLTEALTADGAELMRRPISVSLAEARPNDRRGGGGGGGRHWNDGGYGAPRGGGAGSGDRYGAPPPGGRRMGERDRNSRFPPRDNGYSAGPGEDAERWAPRREVEPVRDGPHPRPAPVEPRQATSAEAAPAAPQEARAPRANPFGAARPADTASKLKELEERIAAREAAEKEATAKAAAAPPTHGPPAGAGAGGRPTAILQRRPGAPAAEGTAERGSAPPLPAAAGGAPDGDGFQEVKGAWHRRAGRHSAGRGPGHPRSGPAGAGGAPERAPHDGPAPARPGQGAVAGHAGPHPVQEGDAPHAPGGRSSGPAWGGRGGRGRGPRGGRGFDGAGRGGAHSSTAPAQAAPAAGPPGKQVVTEKVIVTKVQNKFAMLNVDDK
ncbi:hypothetical protein ACKKBG_A15115 [Auxenochlorella protothecoides x Auxenochlorella symbiontica]